MKLDKAVFNFIEHELCNVEKYSKRLQDMDSISEISFTEIVSCAEAAHMWRIIRAAAKALEVLNEGHRKLYELLYVQNKPWQRTCAEMHVSERTFFRLRRELIVAVAANLGLANLWSGRDMQKRIPQEADSCRDTRANA
ncbi:hypothetical protein DXT63_11850 [Thermoanaerobacteraceae bacterium SP2]|nr:hypothetical protein DXT63_11850 [Thermoanaerobacteraceae bacterium SP2]